MQEINVVTGIAGAGKTAFALRVVEDALRSGLKWYEIGFFSFSRSACAEAAQRASLICGVEPDKMQRDGFFRTLHSSCLRLLGVDAKILIDLDRKKDADWLESVLGSRRGGERGTLAALTADALDAWDNARARLIDVVLNSSVVDKIGLDSQDTQRIFECLKCKSMMDMDLSSSPRSSRTVNDSQISVTVDSRNHQKTQGKCLCTLCDFSDLPISMELEKIFEKQKDHPPSECRLSFELMNYTYKHIESMEVAQTVKKNLSVLSVDNFFRNAENTGFIEDSRVSSVDSQKLSVDNFKTQSEIQTITRGDKAKRISQSEIQTITKYENAKRIEGRMDFTDILIKYAGLSHSIEEGGIRIGKGFTAGSVPAELKLVIVDEYQDCSRLLDLVVQRLSSEADQLWLLGDRYQAVYGFAGSDWRCMAEREEAAKAEGRRTLLNRSWRNPAQVLEWGEEVLREDGDYEERRPITQVDDGSVGMVGISDFLAGLVPLQGSDTMILARAWFALDKVTRALDAAGIPWKSTGEGAKSRWEAPVRIAFVIVMLQLQRGEMISESDWRRITNELPQKSDGREIFQRGIKSKWAKMECSNRDEKVLSQCGDWGASEFFEEYVTKGFWRVDAYRMIADAIERFGADEVRSPSIRVGTVHSVKGAEAENVFCLATSTERASGQKADFWEELFLRYVAITRASKHYRVVVDPVEQARGRALFLACPKGFNKFGEMPVVRRKRTSQVDDVDQKPETHVRREVSGGNLRDQGSPGCDLLLDGSVRRDRDEVRDGTANQAPGTQPADDTEEWWNL